MHNLRQCLLDEQAYLEKIIAKRQESPDLPPEGTLQSSTSHGRRQYYQFIAGDKAERKYISMKNSELIRALAQKDYDRQLYALVGKRLREIRTILKDYDDHEIENIYNSQKNFRRQWIRPAVRPWDEYLQDWMNIPYQGKGFPNDNSVPVILAANGIRVRSKSEKILADYFIQRNLPFKYECPLNLAHYGTVYPDFTFLSRQTRQEIYWEHEGMMDNPEYANSAVAKIALYEKNQIFPGERLILTFETSRNAVNTQQVEQLVSRYLL